MTIYVLPPRQQPRGVAINVTSRGQDWGRDLSPFLLGPVPLYGGRVARNVENAWQFSKAYADHVTDGKPNDSYWPWAEAGWGSTYAHRYPMGKGAAPLFSWWDGAAYGYVDARRKIYAPLYANAVQSRPRHLAQLQDIASGGDLTLVDFDAYDHRALGMTYEDVMAEPRRKMGHGFVLAMLLDGRADLWA